MNLLSIIERIAPPLQRHQSIHALWLEGSWATGKNNDHSDIDVWMDVDDGTFDACIEAFGAELMKLGRIDWEKLRGIYSKEPKLLKHTFHLEGFPEAQMIELDLQEHSRKFVFDRGLHPIKIIFDKDHTIRWGGPLGN